MSKKSIYITRRIPIEIIERFRERFEVEYNEEDQVLTKVEFIEKVKGRDAIVVVDTPIDKDICRAVSPRCKIFASYGVGYNNIDVDAATEYGILVSNAPGVVTDSAADLCFGLLLSVARRLVECDRFVREGNKNWGPMNLLGSQVSGKVIGIIGSGRVGLAMAQRAKAFDMKIIYTDIHSCSDFEQETGGRYVDKETLLREADFVSIHVPLLPSTHHLIGKNELELMKKTAILLNIARGSVVDDKALVIALQNGEIAGAGLDVFEDEPRVEAGLKVLDNVVLTPHVGTATLDTRIAMGELCIKNVIAALDGKIPPTCLNPEVKNI